MIKWIVALIACFIATDAIAGVKHTIGIARGEDGQSVRYIEHHQYLEDGKHVVRYYDTDQNVLLEKEMRYPGLPQHPTLMQSDYLTDTEISILREQDTATMTREQGDKVAEFSFPLTDDTVIDAGFDAYIQDNWASFEESSTQRVKFAVAGQTRLIDMNISRTGEVDDLTEFTVKPANWLIRLIVPDITLYYDDAAQLVRYEGFSNLKQPESGSRQVVIQFQHFELETGLQKPLAEWLPILSRQ